LGVGGHQDHKQARVSDFTRGRGANPPTTSEPRDIELETCHRST